MSPSYGFQQFPVQQDGFYESYPRTINQDFESREVGSFTDMLKGEDDRDSGYYASDSSSYEHYPATTVASSFPMSTAEFVPRTLAADMSSIPTSNNFFEFGSESTTSPAVPSASHSIASIQSNSSSPYQGAVESWNNGDFMRPGSSWGLDTSVFIDPNLIPHSPREEPISAISAHSHSHFSRSQSPASPQHQRLSPYPQQYTTSHPISRQPTETFSDYDSNASTIAAQYEKRSKSPSSDKGSSKDQPCTECGKKYRDLKAHMLTHQRERPEKCPISTCEYYTKGFARKYDCQRHTLTHYKGTMVCGFCPGSGSAAEKSFNRADVFKRHIASVHNVEQSPSNGRKKSPNGTPRNDNFNRNGKCSTCGVIFATAQQFYEHVDECVYSKIVQIDPATEVNERNLDSIKMEDIDPDLLGSSRSQNGEESDAEDEDMEFDEAALAEDEARDESWTSRALSKKAPFSKNGSRSKASRDILSRLSSSNTNKVSKAKRFTKTSLRGKKRKSFPHSWGAAPEKMTTKRRCLFVYDGQNELIRDEMVMHSDMEVKTNIADKFQVSDLDFWTMERANAAIEAAPGPEEY